MPVSAIVDDLRQTAYAGRDHRPAGCLRFENDVPEPLREAVLMHSRHGDDIGCSEVRRDITPFHGTDERHVFAEPEPLR